MLYLSAQKWEIYTKYDLTKMSTNRKDCSITLHNIFVAQQCLEVMKHASAHAFYTRFLWAEGWYAKFPKWPKQDHDEK